MGRIRTAQKGYDAVTSDPRFRTLDSDKNQFKVFDSDRVTFSLNSGNDYSYTKTVTHNLGYRPQAIAWAYYAEADESTETMYKVERFSPLPYGYGVYEAALVASIDKGPTTVSFKFFQQTDFTSPEPDNYTLTNMKMKYIIYIDRE